MEQKILQFIKDNSELQRKLLRELCAIPAPSHKEEQRAAYCKAALESFGAEGVYIDEALNVVFPYCCEGSHDITVFAAHTDTVFPDTTPYPYREDEENIYCPGVNDDTVCVVGIMLTAKFFLEQKIKPQGGILFVLNSCEEGLGNLKGTRQLFRDYDGRVKQFVTADAGLTGIDNVCVGSRRFKVTVHTEGGHSFNAFGNKNAIHLLSAMIGDIYAIEVPLNGGSKTTYNVGLISGGTSVNTIAQKAEMLCEYRSDDVHCLAVMKEKFDAIFAKYQALTEVDIELVGERPCANGVDVAAMDKLIATVAADIESVTGKTPEYHSASTDCNIPLSLGIPAIAVGGAAGHGSHTREEYLEKSSLPVGLHLLILHAVNLTK